MLFPINGVVVEGVRLTVGKGAASAELAERRVKMNNTRENRPNEDIFVFFKILSLE
jgi:hypothetical protein